MLRDLWRRLLGGMQAARPACRLTEDQALEIARAAVSATQPCFVQDRPATDAGIEWLIGTATIGSGVTIRISDATGEVLERRPWGVR